MIIKRAVIKGKGGGAHIGTTEDIFIAGTGIGYIIDFGLIVFQYLGDGVTACIIRGIASAL
ncbi:hypothetical protein SDC9_199995 [bioreactor metagenome]|uniref:Uncharacterized protein n=1 Tax=bioreactor metagenome TaxID=1076179 RepID=A0A645IPK5_9ZZZZ